MAQKENIVKLFANVGVAPTPVEQKKILMDGLKTFEGEVIEVYSPICRGELPIYLGSYPRMTEAQALTCLESAQKAWALGKGEWPMLSPEQRCNAVRKFAGILKENREYIAEKIMWEIAKTRSDAEGEVDRTVQYILDSCDKLEELTTAWNKWREDKGLMIQVPRQPRGIVLCMGPANYPLNETFTTLIPALLMGNVVLFKPAKDGVLLLEPLVDAFNECFPKGVVNTLYGDGREIITPIQKTGKIDVFSFIGATWTADSIIGNNPTPHKTKNVLGLGAKNPGIILPGADIDGIMKEIVKGTLSYNGQRCTALKILFVHSSIREEFLKKYTTAVDALKPGLPWEDGVQLTPVLPGTVHNFTGYINDAVTRGAQILNENGGLVNAGYIHPAVVFPVTSQMKLFREEQFGPVVPIVEFEDISEVLHWIYTSNFGQQISVFGNTETERNDFHLIIDSTQNQTCRVNINTACQRGPDDVPFAGRGDSAMGTLDLLNALLELSIEFVKALKPEDWKNLYGEE
ncbi:MAG: aldehyde dehydrogenase family protein [Candidatus Peribacteria bacterium]|jgi:glyceraldehyde-3-phosphate dehydrogenase (NADP+)|nr:aldehyde dehydrogenase family protein [Candidatus Peribacteria bacterium]